MHPAFKLYVEATPELIQFLENTVLGTNSARYQHFNTAERIKELDNPLHLSFIRNDKIIANITFCRRGKNWYIRYFAFDTVFQRTNGKQRSRGKSILKKELIKFFKEKLSSGEVDEFYSYIDPNNKRSYELAKELGFVKKDTFHTQTFSRISPKLTKRVRKIDKNDKQFQEKLTMFEKESFYYNVKNSDAFYGLFDENNSILAVASANRLNWKILRLPGRFGSFLTRIVPFVPYLRKIDVPNNHQFIGLDHVWVSNNDSNLLSELFESILAIENKSLALWWIDSRLDSFGNVNWGIAHKFLGVNPVEIYVMNYVGKSDSEAYFLISKDFS